LARVAHVVGAHSLTYSPTRQLVATLRGDYCDCQTFDGFDGALDLCVCLG
jgi:hypothetical protein